MGVMTKSIEKKLWDTACDLWVNAKLNLLNMQPLYWGLFSCVMQNFDLTMQQRKSSRVTLTVAANRAKLTISV